MMTLDFNTEERLSLSAAARDLDVHVATVHRWVHAGVRGIRLQTSLLGGRRYTSRQALERFISNLNGGKADQPARPEIDHAAHDAAAARMQARRAAAV